MGKGIAALDAVVYIGLIGISTLMLAQLPDMIHNVQSVLQQQSSAEQAKTLSDLNLLSNAAPCSISITSGSQVISKSCTSQSSVGQSSGGASGFCPAVTNGPCSLSSLQNSCFGNNAYKASGICGQESSGIPDRLSQSDKCTDGTSFSVGLFQINLLVHGSKITQLTGDNSCENLFDGISNGGSTCTNVKDTNQYQRCLDLIGRATSTATNNNIQIACQISGNGINWNPWGANRICKY